MRWLRPLVGLVLLATSCGGRTPLTFLDGGGGAERDTAAPDLSSWLNRMGGGKVLEPLQNAAAEWDAAVARLGLTEPHEAIRAAMRRMLEWRWSEAPP